MVQNVSTINEMASYVAQGLSGKDRAVAAIKQASSRTGVDFAYLLAQATQESGLNASAKASTSSATGLFQFIDQTWLQTVKAHGAEHGLSAYADKISLDSNGVAQVSNPKDKAAILALRNNPEVASLMAAELASDNKESLTQTVGSDVGATDLYMAHFLGAGGARKFLCAMNKNPNLSAADVCPSAAAANKNVFYDSQTGCARSVAEVYAFFDKKFDCDDFSDASIQVASSGAPAVLKRGGEVAYQVYPTKGVTLDSSTSTPFATMLLAQMDMESWGLDTLDAMYSIDATSKYVKAYAG
ncbi:MAG: transglycosylase SLT domain-containing protein [Bdellovibrionales bacterium]